MFIIFAFWELSSACSLCMIKVGILNIDFPIFSTCFAVFQNNLEFVVSVESKPSMSLIGFRITVYWPLQKLYCDI